MTKGAVEAWETDELRAEILRALKEGDYGDGHSIEGRAIAVKASPSRENASKIVVGTAALPPGFSTPPHSHEAEEVALALSGRGGHIRVEGEEYPFDPGRVILVPSSAEHVTSAGKGEPLAVLWFYAPPGSEVRWLEERLREGKS
jgi:gentisate 1,2-dioxygenase